MTETQLAGMDLPGLLELAERSTDPLVRELAKRMPEENFDHLFPNADWQEGYAEGFEAGKAEGLAEAEED